MPVPGPDIEVVAKIEERFRNGESIRSIGKTMGISRGKARRALAKIGANADTRVSPDRAVRIAAMKSAGVDHAEIARVVGVKQNTVRQVTHTSEGRSVKAVIQAHPAITQERNHIARSWGEGRYLLAGDFHVLFHSQRALDAVLDLKGDFDGCVIPGDLIDA